MVKDFIVAWNDFKSLKISYRKLSFSNQFPPVSGEPAAEITFSNVKRLGEEILECYSFASGTLQKFPHSFYETV